MLIEGDVLKADNTRYAYADLVTLTNNGLLYLFASFEVNIGWTNDGTCQLSGSGYITLASYSPTHHKGCGLSQGWYPDTSANAAAANTGL